MSGVYISYPFCAQKCTFCNFASNVAGPSQEANYLERLVNDIRSHQRDWSPDTVYFGGGTPSLIPDEWLVQLMEAIPREALQEVTLECAPGTVTPEKAAWWVRCGVNRVSLGVQSFVTAELRQTGRRHTAEVVARDLQILSNAGIRNVNIDLIAGLPGQTPATWESSLEWVKRLSPPHVSVYLFEIDEDSRLGREALLGGVRYGAALLPNEDVMATLYERAAERLLSIGIHRYEISNFARPGFESKHNLKYWRLEPYFGFGLDAHSFDGRTRWSTPDTLGEFLSKASPRIEESPANLSEERFFVGLRLTDGIRPTSAEWQQYAKPILKWTQAGDVAPRWSDVAVDRTGDHDLERNFPGVSA